MFLIASLVFFSVKFGNEFEVKSNKERLATIKQYDSCFYELLDKDQIFRGTLKMTWTDFGSRVEIKNRHGRLLAYVEEHFAKLLENWFEVFSASGEKLFLSARTFMPLIYRKYNLIDPSTQKVFATLIKTDLFADFPCSRLNITDEKIYQEKNIDYRIICFFISYQINKFEWMKKRYDDMNPPKIAEKQEINNFAW